MNYNLTHAKIRLGAGYQILMLVGAIKKVAQHNGTTDEYDYAPIVNKYIRRNDEHYLVNLDEQNEQMFANIGTDVKEMAYIHSLVRLFLENSTEAQRLDLLAYLHEIAYLHELTCVEQLNVIRDIASFYHISIEL